MAKIAEQPTHEDVESVLELIRPAIRRDGGDVELVGVEGDTARIRFHGACCGCPSSSLTLQHGIERAFAERLPGIRQVVAVK
ncbi:MAG: NifU family protein [Phycisphaerae bacterium]